MAIKSGGSFLITGVAGFIGAAVAGMLLRAGHEVTGVDNLESDYPAILKNHRLRALERDPRFTFHLTDLSRVLTGSGLGRYRKFDAVIHLAGHAGVAASLSQPSLYLERNLHGMVAVLNWSRKHRVPRVVYASSSSVYRLPTVGGLPMREAAPLLLPVASPYAASKQVLEVVAEMYREAYGDVNPLGLRFFSVYGPAGRPDSRVSVFQYVRCLYEAEPIPLYGYGLAGSRDLTYIDDAAAAVVLAVTERSETPGVRGVLNVGAGRPVTTNRIVEHLTEVTGLEPIWGEVVKEKATAVMMTEADPTAARRELGWTAVTPLDTGLRACVEWYRANREWARSIKPPRLAAGGAR